MIMVKRNCCNTTKIWSRMICEDILIITSEVVELVLLRFNTFSLVSSIESFLTVTNDYLLLTLLCGWQILSDKAMMSLEIISWKKMTINQAFCFLENSDVIKYFFLPQKKSSVWRTSKILLVDTSSSNLKVNKLDTYRTLLKKDLFVELLARSRLSRLISHGAMRIVSTTQRRNLNWKNCWWSVISIGVRHVVWKRCDDRFWIDDSFSMYAESGTKDETRRNLTAGVVDVSDTH